MRPIVTITIGVSGSGKTTWAKKECRTNYNQIRVNRDDLRASLFGLTLSDYFKQNNVYNREELITDISYKMINEAVKNGQNVIIDNTHLSIAYIRNILNSIDGDVEFRTEWFNIDSETCIQRDSLRETVIGEIVIRNQMSKYLSLWSKRAEIDKMIQEREKLNFKPVVQDTSLPKAIIFDIDGTLALMNSRTPYEWDKVGEDEVNDSVNFLTEMIHQYNMSDDFFLDEKVNIVICTGRDGKAEDKTKTWLKKHNISYDEFYIRKSGDNRKDSIVKREFLEDIIAKYNVLFAVDDRNQVVKMWRDSGISCFQVAEGVF
jgi:predicted kinase